MFRPSFAVVLFVLVVVAPVRADGLIRSVPEDGQWVKYHGRLSFAGMEATGTVTLRSVGTEDVDGKPARWVEVDMQLEDEPRDVYKMLIPEARLKAGVDPVDHVVRAWRRTGDDEPIRIEENANLDFSFLGAMLHAPVKTTAREKSKKSFPWQRGTLEAASITGARKLDADGRVQGTLTATVWPHDEVPFGVAGLNVDVALENGGSSVVIELAVSDIGKDAKSVLPDRK